MGRADVDMQAEWARFGFRISYRDERAPVQWQKYGLRALLPGVGSPVGSKWNQRWLLARNVVVRL